MKNEKAVEILNEFIKSKNKDLEVNSYWDDKNKDKMVFGEHYKNQEGGKPWSVIGPFSEEEAFIFREFPQTKYRKNLEADYIPKELYNKKFIIGDFEVSVSYKEWNDKSDDGAEYSGGYAYVYRYLYKQWGVFVKYHGCYLNMGKIKTTINTEAYRCKPSQTNWSWIKPTLKKPYILKETSMSLEYQKFNKITDFFKTLDISTLELKNITIPHQEWYDHNQKNGKSINDLSLEEKDVNWLISSEIKDGVYRPEKHTIDNLLFNSKNYKIVLANKWDKKLLQKLGVHTVQLRADAHYNVPSYFDMKGIKIKAPQKVIERYNMEKYCIDDAVVEKIKAEKKKAEDEEKARDYNNKFTLMQHGKVIKTNRDKEDIIEFLENFVPASVIKADKKVNSESIEDGIISTVKPIFDAFENVDKLYIAYWGRYFKYESCGELKDIDYDCESMNQECIEEDDWEQISELYSDNLCPDLDEKVVENKFGWPDRGGIILSVERGPKNKLSVVTEDYDFE